MSRPAPESRAPLVIYGGGGHGLVVAEAAEAAGHHVLGLLDDAMPAAAAGDLAWPLLRHDDPQLVGAAFIVGVGDNLARRRLTQDLRYAGRTLTSVVHPSAVVSRSATLAEGVFVGPQAVVNAHAVLAEGVIVNSGAVAEHHARVGEFAHVGPRAALGGAARAGARTLVGIGAVVLPRVHVGEGCTVAAGAVVTRHVADGQTVVGVPARVLVRGAGA